MTHQQAREDLRAGLHPDAICAVCPWDRLCVSRPTKPTMTERESVHHVSQAQIEYLASGDGSRKSVLTALMLGGHDQIGEICPVLSLRLLGPDGRDVADGIRHLMRSWSDKP